MGSVRLSNVSKTYDHRTALQNINFFCGDGKFMTILGQPGAGKTSLLRIISGLEDVTSGEVYIDDRQVNELPPEARDTAMIFETYSLYPHLNVFDNIAFPLRAPTRKRGRSSDEIRRQVQSVAEMLGIADLLDRLPWQLSGGQRQRVAIGRALVRSPKVFLMDEPLAHLDAKLRNQMRGELKRLQKDVNVTTIYATPDYAEAIAMADHVMVLHLGKVLQYGTPVEVFDRPASMLVAQLVGDPPMNLFEARIETVGGRLRFATGAFTLDAPPNLTPVLRSLGGQDKVMLGVRPTDLIPSLVPRDNLPIAGVVHTFEPLGPSTLFSARVGPAIVSVKVPGEFPVGFEDKIWLGIRAEGLHLFDPKTGERLS